MAAPAAEPRGPAGGAPAGSLAVEWFTAYAEYLRRAAGQSASTIELYEEITDRIASGHLEPAASQELLTSFVQARGIAYSDEFAQLNIRFFRELVRIGTAYAYELAQALMPDTAAPSVSPPEFDPADPAGWFQQLSDYSQQVSGSVAATYQALVDRAASGEAAPSEVQQAVSGYLQRRLPVYLGELGKLYFDLLNGLTELRVRSEQEFLSGVLARSNGGGESFELALTAALGETATASLSIANTHDEVAHVRCHVTEVRRADGVDPAFVPEVTFSPEPLEVPPGHEARLVLTLRLDEERYVPEVLYLATLQITGHGEPRLEVPLRITATQPQPVPVPVPEPEPEPAPAPEPAPEPASSTEE